MITLKLLIEAGEKVRGKGSYNKSWGIEKFENFTEVQKVETLVDLLLDYLETLEEKEEGDQVL